MGDVIPSQVDPGGAQFGQHYELANERVIAALSPITATRSACGDATIGEALAAAGIRRDHDTSMAHDGPVRRKLRSDTMCRESKGGAA
jgi:hypothetical protein